MHSNKKRMAGDDEFQANLQNAQMENEAVENSKTSGGEFNADAQPSQGDTPQKDPQEFLKERTDEISRSQRNAQIRDEIAADPERTKERISGVDRSKFDFSGYSDGDIAKAMQGDEFGEKDYARLTGKSSGGSEGGSGGSNYDIELTDGPGTGGSGGSGVGPGMRQGTTFAQQAIDAAAKSNPVNFKALDQRIHDRPLYMQAKADIKHSETFGDTWSWDSAPKWNTERYKSEPMENRYQDVMDKDDDD